MNIAKYSLVKITPNPERIDCLVVGVVAFSDLGWDVSFSDDTGKITAINPNYPVDSLPEVGMRVKQIASTCTNLTQLGVMMKLMGSFFHLDPFEGVFAFSDREEYLEQMNRIMSESVNPPKKIVQGIKRERSKLRASLKKQFSSLGILASDPSDINDHKIVQRYPIEAKQGLYADFALKNSVMHVTETVDFTMSQQAYTAKKYEAQAKCLVLKAASEICGASTKKYVIVAGGGRNSESALNLLKANAEVYQFEDPRRMSEYLEKIQTAALGRSPLH
jgi:hypothetical protein